MKISEIYPTNNYGNLVIKEFYNSRKVLVEFVDTGYQVWVQAVSVRLGNVKDKWKPSVYGVGVFDVDTKGESSSKTYVTWSSMLARCYAKKREHRNISYEGCEVSEEFKIYSCFKNWYESQVGFDQETFCLDKDLLVRGNKMYSHKTCCLLPSELNVALTNSKATRGSLPIGVTYNKPNANYVAALCINGKQLHLASCVTAEQAFNVYKTAKESHLKALANKWEDQIDQQAYHALMNYIVTKED